MSKKSNFTILIIDVIFGREKFFKMNITYYHSPFLPKGGKGGVIN